MKSAVLFVGIVAFIAAIVNGENPPKVVIMTEALCPNCIDFANTQFKEFLKAKGVFERTEVQFLSWGNAYTETTSPQLCPSPTPGKYNVDIRKCWSSRCVRNAAPALFKECFNDSFDEHTTCQHGSDECLGNRIESCATYFTRNSTTGLMTRTGAEFIECFLGEHHGQKDSTLTCAKKAGISYDQIMSCVNSNLGTEVLREEAITTNDYGTHSGVPYVLVNGNPLSDDDTLLKVVCSLIHKDKPSGCKTIEFTNSLTGMC